MRYASITAITILVCAWLAQAGTRAPVTGDAIVDFQTTMDMPFMTVGNPGNAADTETGYGAVHYTYSIGKFEVTAGQYAEFLNAVAATDTYSLYNPDVWDNEYGCKIERTGDSGSYSYSVASDWADRPVNDVNWGDAARFCNWLTNGMPTGAQDLTTTERGSYFLNGAMSDAELLAVTREPDARYVIPTENEWYKAAYHKNDGVTNNYFDYPTSSDSIPNNILVDPDPGNNANFEYPGSIGSPYYRTEAGEFENSDSPYGTFDMGGNLWEWNDTIIDGLYRGGRGGSFGGSEYYLHVSSRFYSGDHYPTYETLSGGFRVAEVPEPGTLSLLALGGVGVLRRRK